MGAATASDEYTSRSPRRCIASARHLIGLMPGPRPQGIGTLSQHLGKASGNIRCSQRSTHMRDGISENLQRVHIPNHLLQNSDAALSQMGSALLTRSVMGSRKAVPVVSNRLPVTALAQGRLVADEEWQGQLAERGIPLAFGTRGEILVPSGDQAGLPSRARSEVRRCGCSAPIALT